MKYSVILEKSGNNHGAFVLDLPGCVAVGKTKKEALKLIKEAIYFHLEGLENKNKPINQSHFTLKQIDIAQPRRAYQTS